ncbi:MAG: hypothetical protein IPJ26_09740 [Bacteroidetes bacterium]|nr:hypothetical protein [Bacteroidota bacterium]
MHTISFDAMSTILPTGARGKVIINTKTERNKVNRKGYFIISKTSPPRVHDFPKSPFKIPLLTYPLPSDRLPKHHK